MDKPSNQPVPPDNVLMRVALLRVNLATQRPWSGTRRRRASNGLRGSLATAKCKNAIVAKYGPSIKVLFVPKDRVPEPGRARAHWAQIWPHLAALSALGGLRLLQTEWSFPDGVGDPGGSSAVKMKEHDA